MHMEVDKRTGHPRQLVPIGFHSIDCIRTFTAAVACGISHRNEKFRVQTIEITNGFRAPAQFSKLKFK